MSKEKILHKIKNALRNNPLHNEETKYKDIIVPVCEDNLEEYKRLQELNKAEVYDIQEDEILQTLQSIFQKEGIKEVLLPSSLQSLELDISKVIYDRSVEDLRDVLFESECAILQADYGVSNLGVIALSSSVDQPRFLSLITKHCIFLLKKEKILGNLSLVLEEIKKTHPQVLPSNILFIAGPSRTADIELQVVFGVHGPQRVYVLLY